MTKATSKGRLSSKSRYSVPSIFSITKLANYGHLLTRGRKQFRNGQILRLQPTKSHQLVEADDYKVDTDIDLFHALVNISQLLRARMIKAS